jgi:hypothetical protein
MEKQMRNKIFTGMILTVLSLALLGVEVAAKVDLSGTWKLDAKKSEGLPPEMQQTMTVSQKEEEISIETKIIMPQGEQTVPDSYLVNGKTVEVTKPAPGNKTQKIKRTSQWTEKGLKVSEEAEIETPEGEKALVKVERRWTLSEDGKTLVIEMEVSSPQGKQTSKRTFVKL